MVVNLIGIFNLRSILNFNLQYFKSVPLARSVEVDILNMSFRFDFPCLDCRRLGRTLALCWVFGLFLGCLIGIHCAQSISSIDYFSVCHGELPLFSLLIFRLLPLFVCVISWHISLQFILVCFAILRGMLFSLSAVCLLFGFGTASWLLSFLLLSGDALSISSFWFVLFRSFNSCIQKRTIFVSVAVISFASLLEYLYIAPFMAKLI